jgi:hypothetical protein
MRVSVRLVATMLAALPVCAAAALGSVSHPPAHGPDPVAAQWRNWPYEVSCEGGLPFDPDSAFSGETNAERGGRPSERALARLLKSGRLPRVRLHDWRALGESADVAEFAAGRLTALPDWATAKRVEWLRFREVGGRWEWESYRENCKPHSLLRGIEAGTWTLNEGQELNPNTRRVLVDLGPAQCDDGRSPQHRVQPPAFRERNGALLMTIWLKPPLPGHRCGSVFEEPLAVRLPERLGRRDLLDGGLYPPRPAEPIVSGGNGSAGQAAASRSARLRQ